MKLMRNKWLLVLTAATFLCSAAPAMARDHHRWFHRGSHGVTSSHRLYYRESSRRPSFWRHPVEHWRRR